MLGTLPHPLPGPSMMDFNWRTAPFASHRPLRDDAAAEAGHARKVQTFWVIHTRMVAAERAIRLALSTFERNFG
jgi:hypothetical protein